MKDKKEVSTEVEEVVEVEPEVVGVDDGIIGKARLKFYKGKKKIKKAAGETVNKIKDNKEIALAAGAMFVGTIILAAVDKKSSKDVYEEKLEDDESESFDIMAELSSSDEDE